MTAEIALLNRKAVALAADSIVTLTGNSVYKTYDSAEKIFELSRNKPIGLMTYNNTEILNIPIEIMIREFRKKFNEDVPKIECVWAQFKEFIINESNNYANIEDYQKTHLTYLITPLFLNLEKASDIIFEIKQLLYRLIPNKIDDNISYQNKLGDFQINHAQ